MRKLELYQDVSLIRDVPEEGLKKGDVALLIEHLQHPSGGEDGVILEIFNALGESMNLATVPVSAVEPLRADQIPAVRTLDVEKRGV